MNGRKLLTVLQDAKIICLLALHANAVLLCSTKLSEIAQKLTGSSLIHLNEKERLENTCSYAINKTQLFIFNSTVYANDYTDYTFL